MERSACLRLGCAVVALLALLLAGWVAYVFHSFGSAADDVTDPRRYPAILGDLGHPTPTKLNIPTIAHFPSTIPAAATNVRLYFRSGAFQGGTQLQLRVQLPTKEVTALLEKVRPLAKDIQTGGDIFDAVNAHHGLPSARFRDPSNKAFAVDGLSTDFKVFVLDAKDSTPQTWSHGYSYGVAISDKINEVIYWLEDW